MNRREALRAMGALVAGSGIVAEGGPVGSAAAGDPGAGRKTGAVEAVRWVRDYGAEDETGVIGSSIDRATATTVNDDGEMVVVGVSDTNLGSDAWAGKLTAGGDRPWIRQVGEDFGDAAFDVIPAAEGSGYVIAGYQQTESERDAWVLRIAEDGSPEWSLTVDEDRYEEFRAVTYDDFNDRYVAAGLSGDGDDRQGLVTAVSTDGQRLWDRRYGPQGPDVFNDITQVNTDYVAAGVADARDPAAGRAWLVRIDETGEEEDPLRSRQYGTPDLRQSARTVIQDEGGGYVFGGGIGDYGPGGQASGLVTAVDRQGSVRWSIPDVESGAIDGSTPLGTVDVADAQNRVEGLYRLPDGYLVSGLYQQQSTPVTRTSWLAKVTSDGEVAWRTAIAPLTTAGGDAVGMGTVAFSLAPDDQGYRLVGSVASEADDGVEVDARVMAVNDVDTLGRTLQARLDRNADGLVDAPEVLSVISAYNDADGSVSASDVLATIRAYNENGRWSSL